MTSENNDAFDLTEDAKVAEEAKPRESRRTLPIVLGLILAVLILLLGAVIAYLAVLLIPAGSSTKGGGADTGLTWVRSIYGWGRSADQQLYAPTDVAIADDGTIWVAESTKARIIGFNPDGSYKGLVHFGPAGSTAKALKMPQSLDIGPDGNLYIADYLGNKIVVASPQNKYLRSFDVTGPMEVAVTGDRIVIGTMLGVGIHDMQGNLLQQLGPRGKRKTDFDNPRGVVVGPDDSIYVTDMHNNRLDGFTKAGKMKWQTEFGAVKLGSKTTTSPVQLPAGLTMDGAGHLVFVDPFSYVIAIADSATGKLLGTYGDYGHDDGMFNQPTGIAYDSNRDWFAIADTTNNRVQIVRLSNTAKNPVSAAGRRALSSPLFIACSVPLVLLLIAVMIMFFTRRGRRANEQS